MLFGLDFQAGNSKFLGLTISARSGLLILLAFKAVELLSESQSGPWLDFTLQIKRKVSWRLLDKKDNFSPP